MPNPFNMQDEDEKQFGARYVMLRQCERYWNSKALRALLDDKPVEVRLVYAARANFYYQLRVAEVVY